MTDKKTGNITKYSVSLMQSNAFKAKNIVYFWIHIERNIYETKTHIYPAFIADYNNTYCLPDTKENTDSANRCHNNRITNLNIRD